MAAITTTSLEWFTAEGKFPPLKECPGYDLNRNGKAEETERADLDGNGAVSEEEWKAFLDRNRSKIEPAGPFFKHYYQHGQAFSPGNPIHDFLQIESSLASDAEIANAYRFIGDILARIRDLAPLIYGRNALEEKQAMLTTAYHITQAAGIELGGEVDLMSQGIAGRRLDCDTSGMLMLAVGHEMKWPVYLVSVPGHAFVRWDSGAGTRFNIDEGEIFDDDYYMAWPRAIAKESVAAGVYLQNLTPAETRARVYEAVGYVKSERGAYKEALAYFDEAIRISRNSPSAYYNRGVVRGRLGRFKDSLADLDAAIGFDPKDAAAYDHRGLAKTELGRHKEAIADFDEAIRIDANRFPAYHNRGYAKILLKRYEEAIADFDKAIAIKPEFASAFYNRGCAKLQLQRYEEAIADFDKALTLDPKNAGALSNREKARRARAKKTR